MAAVFVECDCCQMQVMIDEAHEIYCDEVEGGVTYRCEPCSLGYCDCEV